MSTNNVKLLHRDLLMGDLWSMWYPINISLAVNDLVLFSEFEKN